MASNHMKVKARRSASDSAMMDSSLVAAVRGEIWAVTSGSEFPYVSRSNLPLTHQGATNQIGELETMQKSRSRVM